MEEAIRWAVWGFSLVLPFFGLAWCLTTPTSKVEQAGRTGY